MLRGLHLIFCLGKEPVCQWRRRETRVQSLGREDPWRRKWQPTPASLPRESHGPRSLASYSPWGLKESDMTELTHTQTHILIHAHTHVGRGPHLPHWNWVGEGWEHAIHTTFPLTLPHLSLPGTHLPSPEPEAPLAHFFRLCLLPWTKGATPRKK